MGITVCISHAVGANDSKKIGKAIANAITLSVIFALILSFLTVVFANQIMNILSTPVEAFKEAKAYSTICFLGIPFITAYNVVSSIFRGNGDTKSPMFFVMIAGIFNIFLDYIFIGKFSLGASGAAFATVISQAISVLIAIIALFKSKRDFTISRKDFSLDKRISTEILKIGLPIAFQEGLIQISFLVITVIANSRGLIVAASVGIVEKIIGFMFLVPSAFLSSVSALASQNIGAKKYSRATKTLFYGISICVSFGLIVCILSQFFAEEIVSIFSSNNSDVVKMASQYLRSYTIDCIIAGIHFCFSGFFCAYGKSMYSFIHNILSVMIFRIPLSYFASIRYPENLFPMGLAAPIGSTFSAILCVFLFIHLLCKMHKNN